MIAIKTKQYEVKSITDRSHSTTSSSLLDLFFDVKSKGSQLMLSVWPELIHLADHGNDARAQHLVGLCYSNAGIDEILSRASSSSMDGLLRCVGTWEAERDYWHQRAASNG